ncbi:hypothetical protein IGI43_001990 [Enterococcus sp. AZ126]
MSHSIKLSFFDKVNAEAKLFIRIIVLILVCLIHLFYVKSEGKGILYMVF